MANADNKDIRTLSAETDSKYAAGKAVEEIVRRIVRAQETDTIDKVLVVSGGSLRLADISLFRIECVLTVVAEPSGARITLNGVVTDTLTVTVGSSVLVQVEAEGYATYTTTVAMDGDKELHVSLVKYYFTASAPTAELVQGASAFAITVESNDRWTAQSSEPWLAVDTVSGTGDADVLATVAENTGSEERTAAVTFTTDNCGETVLEFTQAANIYLTLGPESLAFANEGETLQVTVGSSSAWSYNGKPDWITLITPSVGSAGETTVNMTASSNTGSQRSGTVAFTNGDGISVGLPVIQYGRGTPDDLTLEPDELDGWNARICPQFVLTAGNGVTDVRVESNCGWGSTGVLSVNSLYADGSFSVDANSSLYVTVTLGGQIESRVTGSTSIYFIPYNGDVAGNRAVLRINIVDPYE